MFRRVRTLVFLLSAAVACLSMLPLASAAQETSPASRVGGSYVGVGFSYGSENFDRNDASNIDDAQGGVFWLGYRLSSAWAIETQVEYLTGFDLTVAGQDGGGQYVAATLNAKIFPLSTILPEVVEPFLFAGAGAGRVQVSSGLLSTIEEIGFIARFGGGVDFYVLPNVALQASTSYVQGTQDLQNFNYVSTVAGVQYSF